MSSKARGSERGVIYETYTIILKMLHLLELEARLPTILYLAIP
jgi:hypothetical protein